MEFQCQREALVQGIATVERAVSTRDTQPLLTGILVEAQKDRLRLVATDLELGVECFVPANVSAEGAAVLDGRVLAQIARKLDGEQITYRPGEGGLLELSGGRARFSLHARSAEEYPALPAVEAPELWRIRQAELRRMIRQTIFACATEDARPFLTGVLLEVAGTEVRMVATDIYRLAVRSAQLAAPASGEAVAAIVPARALQELLRVLAADGDDEVEFVATESQAFFQAGPVKVITRLIDGQFPPYQRALPQDGQRPVRIKRSDLLAAVDRAALLSAKRGMSLVRLEVGQELLSVAAQEAEVGQVHEEVPVSGDGGEAAASFQTYYLMDALRALDNEEVLLDVGDGIKQGCVRPVSDEKYTYVLMPVRVG